MKHIIDDVNLIRWSLSPSENSVRGGVVFLLANDIVVGEIGGNDAITIYQDRLKGLGLSLDVNLEMI